MMQCKLASAIIPVHNGEKYLAQAIESVLMQSYRPIELVVVDDGSTDSTAAVARSYSEVRYVHQLNQGPPAARNTGLAHTSGELISFLDHDDYWAPYLLAEHAEHLARHPETGCVIGRFQNFLDPGIKKPGWVTESMLQQHAVCLALSASLIHRWVFDRVGAFHERFWHADDLDWFFRIRDAGIVIDFTSSNMLYRRIHGANVSHNQHAVAEARILSLKEHMDRIRRGISRVQVGA